MGPHPSHPKATAPENHVCCRLPYRRQTHDWQPSIAAFAQDLYAFQEKETGYQRIQGTKPQTLAYALQDSPSGLAAWILEKLKVSDVTVTSAAAGTAPPLTGVVGAAKSTLQNQQGLRTMHTCGVALAIRACCVHRTPSVRRCTCTKRASPFRCVSSDVTTPPAGPRSRPHPPPLFRGILIRPGRTAAATQKTPSRKTRC
jgi:hypothetical protein